MPELPEVETIVRDLQAIVLNQSIVNIVVFDSRVIRHQTQHVFIKGLKNQTITKITRRGKAIIFHLANKTFLLVQLGMTGQLVYGNNLKKEGCKETKIVFQLPNKKCLNYNDQRMFGRLTFTKNLDRVSFLQNIGPEPLDPHVDNTILFQRSRKRAIAIKPLLMDQHFLAGIGNIYACEILFNAGVNPSRAASKVTRKQWERIHHFTVTILQQAIQLRGSSFRNYRDASGEKGQFIDFAKVYGREGEKCFQCESPILRMFQAGRSTFYCQTCQT